SKSYAATMRHANEFWAGEHRDEETGRLHLASDIFHAMARMVLIVEHHQYDDRIKPGESQVQKENLKAFTDEMLEHNRIAVKNYLDNESPIVKAARERENFLKRVGEGNPPRSGD